MKTNLVTIKDGRAVTSSLQVAQKFGKEHRHILRDIRELECTTDFKESNFGLSFYISEVGNGAQKKNPMYLMTRDGFTFLVMGFTGKLASKFKEEYIAAFNKMEQHIKQGTSSTKMLEGFSSFRFSEMNSYYSQMFNVPLERPADLVDFSWNKQQSEKENAEQLSRAFNNNLAVAAYYYYKCRVYEMKNEKLISDISKDIKNFSDCMLTKYC